MFNQEYWDNLYASEVYMFGESPNLFLKEKLKSLNTGKILLPAEGEGRNAVFAAGLGWNVSAFDLSEAAKQKAEVLAQKAGVKIDYCVGDIEQLDFEPEDFDVLALIFAHFIPEKRTAYHQKLASYVKQGGLLILQGFGNGKSLDNKDFKTPNPLYYDLEQLKSDFANFEVLKAEENILKMNEGIILRGESSIVSLYARKK